MHLTLKKIAFSESLSEETYAFTADVYLDGQLVAHAKNTGQGGSTDLQAHAKPRVGNDPKQHAEMRANRAVMARYEEWAQQQPNSHLGVFDWAPEGLARSLEADVDAAFEEWLRERDARKDQDRLKRLCKKQWVFTLAQYKGKPTDANSIFTIPRTLTHDIKAIGQHLREKHGENLKEFFNEIYG